MKKKLLIAVGAVIALGIVLTVVAGSAPFLKGGMAVAQEMDGEDPTEPVSTGPEEYQVIAEAAVVPVRHAALSLSASGIAAEVLVEEGADVVEGQVILRLENTHQRVAVAQAEAGLASAQAQLAALEAGPRSQEIATAQASLDAARAGLGRLEEGARPEDIEAAKASLAAAEAALQRLFDGPDSFTRIAAEADLANAEAALRRAQAAYDLVAGSEDVAMLPQSLELQQASNAYAAAKARYDALFAEPDADMVAGARAAVKQAQASLERLLQPATASELAEAEAMVRQAQAQLDLLLAGVRAEEISMAEAVVAEAEGAVEQARASVADTELRAPFAGVIADCYVNPGEQVVAGMPVVELADLSALQVETDDLTELDIVQVQEGDEALVTFDAIEGLEIGGTVVRIEPIGREKLGDITYAVVVRLHEQDARLRWNMTAVVTIP
ncbi:MAG: HlyD family secretion protein [Anaerolineae bacterium]